VEESLLLDVWREAGRNVGIERLAESAARILTHRLPVDRLVIMTFDWSHGQVLTRASWRTHHSRSASTVRTLRAGERRDLQAWIRRPEVLHRRAAAAGDGVTAILLGDDDTGDWLLGPLSNEHGAAGALLLRAQPPEVFRREHVRLCESLLEPFSAALENDRRLHELEALREAAEADKRSALSRLGRDGLVDTVVGAEGGLQPVLARVKLVAKSDMPILILGETGSGKEVIARAIHEQSPRAGKPFIRVNCGAIPPELIDSELFGHEKGAFTGAAGARRGWFERADEGTLLLDEIGELPAPAQVRLLRVLQEGAFERVGGERATHVNVRIVAATHRDLPAMVQAGRFREDLWYRIAGFPILLPPLREHKQDIPALAEHFAARAARRFGLPARSPTADDVELLRAYDWPGNIREFASVIDRAAILGDGERLEVRRALGGMTPPTVGSRAAPSASVEPAGILPLADAMKHHIELALRSCRGRIEGSRGAAKLLGINPHTLRGRMRKLKVAWTEFRPDPE